VTDGGAPKDKRAGDSFSRGISGFGRGSGLYMDGVRLGQDGKVQKALDGSQDVGRSLPGLERGRPAYL